MMFRRSRLACLVIFGTLILTMLGVGAWAYTYPYFSPHCAERAAAGVEDSMSQEEAERFYEKRLAMCRSAQRFHVFTDAMFSREGLILRWFSDEQIAEMEAKIEEEEIKRQETD